MSDRQAMSKREQNKEATISNIKKAFILLYAKNGLDKVTINELCKKSNIVKSTFYTYFDDKYAILDDIENDLLSNLSKIADNLQDVDLAIVDKGLPLDKASDVVEFIKNHLDEFNAILGPFGDPRFEMRWKTNIEKGFLPKFKQEKGNLRNAEIACTLFSSALIGFFRYYIFKNNKITNNELAIMLGNTLKYALYDFNTFV
ncbi:MAG: TetR/AcrR family transcriptional regulator [Parasporobacterium sp.]|nr:TetR/AcrR family transcriptional regulator [Parasporobacterium sp.]